MISLTIEQARKLRGYAQDRRSYCADRIDELKGELAYWAQEAMEAAELARYLDTSVRAELTRRD